MKNVIKILIFILIFVIILFIPILLISFLTNERTALYINWGINIPRANNVNIIYNYEFREGEDLEIWNYKTEDIEKIAKNDNFKSIDEENKEIIEEKLNDYYRILDDNEKKLFNTNVDVQALLLPNNHFAYISEDDITWLLLILDSENCKLYYFSNIY